MDWRDNQYEVEDMGKGKGRDEGCLDRRERIERG